MKRILFVLTALLASSVFAYSQNNLVGKWTGEVQGRGGPQTMTLELKMDAGKLAGTLTNGQQPAATLSDVKVDGTKVTFNQVQNFNGNDVTIAYSGEVKGDELTLTRQGGGGGRGAGGGGGREPAAVAVAVEPELVVAVAAAVVEVPLRRSF